jgi:hypothetical protein
MAVVASATGAAVFGLSGVAAGLAGGALLGAGAGGLYSAITGDGNILNSMLTGGLIGGAAGGLGAAAGAAGAGTTVAEAGATGLGAPGAAASTVATSTPALTAAQMSGMTAAEAAAMTPAQLNAIAAANGVVPELATSLPGQGLLAAPNVIKGAGDIASAGLKGKEILGYGLAGTAALKLLGGQQGGLAPASATDPGTIRPYSYSNNQVPSTGEYPSLYPTAQYDANGMPILDTKERNYFNQKMEALTPYSAKVGTPNPNVKTAASGGIMDSYRAGQFNNVADYDDESGSDSYGMAKGGISRYNIGGVSYDQATQTYSGLPQMAAAPAGDMSPLPADLVSQLTSQYQTANPYKYSYDPAKQMYNKAIPSMAQLNAFKAEQDRAAAEQAALSNPAYDSGGMGAANGGLMPYNLGSYSDGGRLLKGPGDGVSDDIPATIANKQPARLADGEFVIPARIVSEIGNGSTDAGAKRLYAMMDRIQEGRKKTIGKKNVAKDTKAKDKLLA